MTSTPAPATLTLTASAKSIVVNGMVTLTATTAPASPARFCLPATFPSP